MKQITREPRPPHRRRGAHKGTFGHLLALCGSVRMTGAALLTTGAGLRSGAGLVTLGVPSGVHPLVAPAMLSAMSLPLPPDDGLLFSPEAVEPALSFAVGVTGLALGPGMTTANPVAEFVLEVARRASRLNPVDALRRE